METYLIYIGRVALAAGAFYIAFLLLFQNQKQFGFNRFYLPVSLALSFLIPMITFTEIRYIDATLDSTNSLAFLPELTQPYQTLAFQLEWFHYLFGLYILGVVGFLFHLLLGHLKAISIIRKSRIQNLFKKLVNITKNDIHPFSFFNKIVLSEKTLNHPNLEMIVEHEHIHVKEKHTLDILFAELLFLLQWFNPFAWLIKDAIKNNLEYKTDQQIAEKYNPQTYQLAMVGLADKKGVAPFLTALNGSQLKNRIVMMKKKTENKFAIVKQLAVLPLLTILIMGLSNKEVITEVVQGTETFKKIDPEFFGKIYKDGLLVLEDYGEAAPLIILNDKVVTEKVIIAESDLKWGEVIQPEQAIEKYGEKGRNGVLVFNTEKDRDLEDAIAENKMKSNVVSDANKNNGKTEPNSNINSDEIYDDKVTRLDNLNQNLQGIKIDLKGLAENYPNCLVLMNGIETKQNIEDINPESIRSYEVLRGERAIFRYGEKAKNGVISVTTKDSNHNIIVEQIKTGYPSPLELGLTTTFRNSYVDKTGFDFGSFENVQAYGDPIVIVDGQRYDSMDDANIDANEIANISVLKNETAAGYEKIYGEQAKNGVVIINTKTKYNSDEDKPKPLIVINGVVVGDKKIEDIKPETIESMNVLKDEKATEKYGEKGKDGVIEIKLKPERINTTLKLRKFFAERIKYPVEAQKNGIVGKISMAATFDNNGIIKKIDKASLKYDNLDEVVVVATNPEKKPHVQDNDSEILRQEMIRIINLIPAVDIEELKGKTINLTVNFTLQD